MLHPGLQASFNDFLALTWDHLWGGPTNSAVILSLKPTQPLLASLPQGPGAALQCLTGRNLRILWFLQLEEP